MEIWIDAQLSPFLANFLKKEFGLSAFAVREIGLREARDEEIFARAKNANTVIMTKDQDFCTLVERCGPPPQMIWITCGNTSNGHLQEVLRRALPSVLRLL